MMTPVYKDMQRLGVELRLLRTYKKKSLKEMEAETGIPDSNLGELERGKYKNVPVPSTVIKISKAYGISVTRFMNLAGYK